MSGKHISQSYTPATLLQHRTEVHQIRKRECQGTLKVRRGGSSEWQEYRATLKNDILSLSAPYMDHYQCNVDQIRSISCKSKDDPDHAFSIRTKEEQIWFKAPTEDAKRDWLFAFQCLFARVLSALVRVNSTPEEDAIHKHAMHRPPLPAASATAARRASHKSGRLSIDEGREMELQHAAQLGANFYARRGSSGAIQGGGIKQVSASYCCAVESFESLVAGQRGRVNGLPGVRPQHLETVIDADEGGDSDSAASPAPVVREIAVMSGSDSSSGGSVSGSSDSECSTDSDSSDDDDHLFDMEAAPKPKKAAAASEPAPISGSSAPQYRHVTSTRSETVSAAGGGGEGPEMFAQLSIQATVTKIRTPNPPQPSDSQTDELQDQLHALLMQSDDDDDDDDDDTFIASKFASSSRKTPTPMTPAAVATPNRVALERQPSSISRVEPCGEGTSRHGVWSAIGSRPRMEDAHAMIEDFWTGSPEAPGNLAYYGVFDGHGGVAAANFAAEQLHDVVMENLKAGMDAQAALTAAFATTDDAFMRACVDENTIDKSPGCTALVLLVAADKLVVANIGDCRAVLSRSGDASQLSVTHSPLSESTRIEAAGGWITQERELAISKLQQMDMTDPLVRKHAKESFRWLEISRVNGELGVSRAFGDYDYKGTRKHTFDWLYWPTGAQPAGHSFSADLVIAVPDTAEITVTAEDEFVILACDGLWDVLEPQPSVDIIRQALRDGVSPMEASRLLVDLALKLGSSDNVTVMVVVLNR